MQKVRGYFKKPPKKSLVFFAVFVNARLAPRRVRTCRVEKKNALGANPNALRFYIVSLIVSVGLRVRSEILPGAVRKVRAVHEVRAVRAEEARRGPVDKDKGDNASAAGAGAR